MKKIILSLLSLIVFGGITYSQTVNIPDANFKAYLVGNAAINSNGDTEIQIGEATNFSGSISCQNLNISDLTGIEAFVSLIALNCDDNQLTSLDLTNNIYLQGSLRFKNNAITTITLPPTSSIVQLWASFNPFTQIDISGQTSLEMIRLIGCTGLTSLDLSTNLALDQLFLNSTNSLGSIDVSNNTNLIYISIGYSGITSFDISNNPLVNSVTLNDNNLTYLNMANGNNMSFAPGSFDATNCPNLTCIEVDNVAFSNAVWNTDVDAGVTFSTDCSVVGGVLVTSISVQGQGGVSSYPLANVTLQMEAVVLPANATDPSFTWTVQNGTGSATIDANGLLTASAIGDVTVGAVASDGSNVYGITTITITNGAASTINEKINAVNVYPNPTTFQLKVTSNEPINDINILDLSGKVIISLIPVNGLINVSDLPNGVYILQVNTGTKLNYTRFIKQ